jgi:butyrate kinase
VTLNYKIFVINPGSGSTKIALYNNNNVLFEKSVQHPAHELMLYENIRDQRPYRKKCIDEILKKNQICLKGVDVIVGRGGPLQPMPGGIYIVDSALENDLNYNFVAEHASLLGGLLAKSYADELNVKAYIVDPVSVDEMDDLARFSGHPEIPRVSLAHALNIKAVARATQQTVGKKYSESRLIIAHLGSGISITAHLNGKMVDVSNANSGGPFSPERAGELPVQEMLKWIDKKGISNEEAIKIFTRKSGLYAYLGTIHAGDVEKMILSGDKKAEIVIRAMVYQISKSICGMGAVLNGEIDAVILTGGLAFSDLIVNLIKERISFLSKIIVFPGEDEMGALADAGARILNKDEDTVN